MKSKAAWIGIALSVIAIAILFWRIDLRDLAAALGRADTVWLLPALAGLFAILFVRAWRWSVLMGGARFWTTYHANAIGYMLNSTLPLRLGEVARAYVMSKKEGMTMAQAFSSVIVERLLDLATVVLLFAWYAQRVPTPPSFTRAAQLATIAIVAGVVFAALLVWKGDVVERLLEKRVTNARAKGFLARFREVRAAFRTIGSAKRMAHCIGLTALVWAVTIVQSAMCLRAFMPSDLTKAGVVVVSSNLGGAVPSAPGGLGIVQGFATTALVVPFGVNVSDALAFAFVWSLGAQLILVVHGLFSMWRIGVGLREIREGAKAP